VFCCLNIHVNFLSILITIVLLFVLLFSFNDDSCCHDVSIKQIALDCLHQKVSCEVNKFTFVRVLNALPNCLREL
jgi:hypothetical protein